MIVFLHLWVAAHAVPCPLLFVGECADGRGLLDVLLGVPAAAIHVHLYDIQPVKDFALYTITIVIKMIFIFVFWALTQQLVVCNGNRYLP